MVASKVFSASVIGSKLDNWFQQVEVIPLPGLELSFIFRVERDDVERLVPTYKITLCHYPEDNRKNLLQNNVV
jgi:hypothetical protein